MTCRTTARTNTTLLLNHRGVLPDLADRYGLEGSRKHWQRLPGLAALLQPR